MPRRVDGKDGAKASRDVRMFGRLFRGGGRGCRWSESPKIPGDWDALEALSEKELEERISGIRRNCGKLEIILKALTDEFERVLPPEGEE